MNVKKVLSYIIDTNVLMVANWKYPHADDTNVFKCQNFLIDVREKHLSVDSLGFIFKEYFSHASRSGQPGIGDKFAKWLWDNQWDTSVCEQVLITPDPEKGFLEFPEEDDLKDFDMEDRKFVAVAVSSKFNAIICNATDSDWWNYKDAFKKVGIRIKFLCPELLKRQ